MNNYNSSTFRKLYFEEINKFDKIKKYIDSISKFDENDIFDLYQQLVNDKYFWKNIMQIIEDKYVGKEESLQLLKDIIYNPIIAKY